MVKTIAEVSTKPPLLFYRLAMPLHVSLMALLLANL